MAESRLTVVTCAALALSACASASRPVSPATPRPLARDVSVYRPTANDRGRPQGPAIANPGDTVTLRDVVALALLHSPDLAAFAWETRAREARVVQAGRLPNPVIGILAEDINTAAPAVASGTRQIVQPQTTIQLSQLIELAGKRTARQRLAARDRDVAAWDYEAARIDVLTRVTHSFIDVLSAQEMVTLTRQSAQLVEQVQQSASARVVAGVVSPVEETKADVAVAAARVEADRALRMLETSRERLASQWGGSTATFRRAAGDLSLVPNLPSVTTLKARLTQNPELARWAVAVSQREAALAIERSKRLPDITLTAGQRRFADVRATAYLIGASIPVPLFDRNGDAAEEAKSRLNKAYEERRAAEANVSVTLSETYRALSSAHQEVTALRETVLPLSRQIFEAVDEGYRLGRFGYLDVLDAQRTLIAARGQYLRAVSDYHKAVADVERLIGEPLSAIPVEPR